MQGGERIDGLSHALRPDRWQLSPEQALMGLTQVLEQQEVLTELLVVTRRQTSRRDPGRQLTCELAVEAYLQRIELQVGARALVDERGGELHAGAVLEGHWMDRPHRASAHARPGDDPLHRLPRRQGAAVAEHVGQSSPVEVPDVWDRHLERARVLGRSVAHGREL